MRLQYYTREGHFNWLDTSEVSFSTNVAVYDGTERIKVCNFTPEYDLGEGNDLDEIVNEIEQSLKRYWNTSDDRNEMVSFLKEHEEEINRGNAIHERETLVKEVESKMERIKFLENTYRIGGEK